jgi:hypothetical protein
MLAISTGVSASELNESMISLLQTVVEGKFVIGPVGTEEEAPNVEDGKFVIGPVSEDGVLGNVVEGNLVIGPVGTEEEAPDVEDGKFVIGPVGTEEEAPDVEEGEGTIACVSGAGENQAISATAAKMTDGRRWISCGFDRRFLNFTAQILRRNKVEIHLERAEHDSGLMHERIVGSKRNVFNAV